MALIRQAEFERVASDGISLNLGDLAQEASAIIARAKGEAERIVANAKAERAKLIAGGREAGLAQGIEEGRAQGRKQGAEEGRAAAIVENKARLTALSEGWEKALTQWNADRSDMMEAARVDVVRLACAIAEKVTHRRLELDPALVGEQVGAALSLLSGKTAAVVSVNPEDLELARSAVPGVVAGAASQGNAGDAHITIVADASLARGGCVVRTAGHGVIDATVASQVERITQLLLPGEGAGAAS